VVFEVIGSVGRATSSGVTWGSPRSTSVDDFNDHIYGPQEEYAQENQLKIDSISYQISKKYEHALVGFTVLNNLDNLPVKHRQFNNGYQDGWWPRLR
jgi:hypothetical protein